jgi:N-acetylglucosaminyl-diphospho-decaprenol L-rhamnosyltransferase
MSVDVIIVAFNSGHWLARAVQSALNARLVDSVIVVDNASTDTSLSHLPLDPRLHILRNARNLGFATACNLGAARSAAQQLLFLNPDCILAVNDVAQLAAHLQADVGIVSAQLLNQDGSSQAASLRYDPTPRRAIAQALGLAQLGVHQAAPATPGVVQVQACSGALMLMPRALFTQMDGFDSGYFLHCEDLDLCRRVRAAGWRVLVDTRVRVLHNKGTSSSGNAQLVARAKYAGMLRYFQKFDAAQSSWPMRILVRLGAWLRFRMGR